MFSNLFDSTNLKNIFTLFKVLSPEYFVSFRVQFYLLSFCFCLLVDFSSLCSEPPPPCGPFSLLCWVPWPQDPYPFVMDWCLCPPRFICWNPNAHGDGTRRWAFGECLGHEGGVLGKGISALTKEAQSTPQSFPPYEDTTEAWFESGPSPNHPGILTWLPASRIVRSKCLFFIRTVVFCYSSLKRLRHHPILLPCRK